MKNKIICIGGPTAVGKTALAIKLANLYNGEIISCDSIAIYKELDIGSAKPTLEEQKMAIHHQINIVEPDKDYSVYDYVLSTRKIIDDIINRGKLPIIVGGTGLFMKAVLFPYDFSDNSKDLLVRQKYEELAEKNGNLYVYNKLKEIDPESAEKLHPNDVKRVIRALEIYETSGEKKVNNSKLIPLYDYFLIFLNGERKKLYDRINFRVEKMLEHGLETEVRNLIKNYNLTEKNQSMQGIGYKEWFDYFSGKITYDQLIYNIKINSRHYAKRQITWFKAMLNVKEYDYNNIDLITKDVYNFISGENQMKNLVIALDGPAGAGKTTIAKLLSEKLDILYLNTGAIYRALGIKCLKCNLNPENELDALFISKNTNINVTYENGEQQIYLDDEKLDMNNLHTDIISEYASKISKHIPIRQLCVDIQRKIASNISIIVDGRDIGSVVLPNANYKFYLDADVRVRAQRRYNDLVKLDNSVSYDNILQEMKERDYNDMHRQNSPLVIAKGAIVIDSTNLSIEQVVNKMLEYIKE